MRGNLYLYFNMKIQNKKQIKSIMGTETQLSVLIWRGEPQQTLNKVYFLRSLKSHCNFVKLDPDPHWDNQLDLEQQKINADPPICRYGTRIKKNLHIKKLIRHEAISQYGNRFSSTPSENSVEDVLICQASWQHRHQVILSHTSPQLITQEYVK